jgi:hypothetical protein
MEPDYQRRWTIAGAAAALIIALIGIVAAATGVIPLSPTGEPPSYQRPLIHGQ